MGGNAWLYLLVLIVVVILINLALVAMLRGGRQHRQIGLFRQFFVDMRNPYRKEDEMLRELSQRVATLNKEHEELENKNNGE
jgi:hypothetical protein